MCNKKSHNDLKVVSEKKNPALLSGIFLLFPQFSHSKQLQLLAWRVHRLGFAVAENLHFAKLLVGDAQYPNIAKLRHERLHPLDMHLRVFAAGTMPQVDRKLEHREAVSHDALAKIGVGLTLFLRLRRQIEKHKHPHNPVFTESVHHISIIG